MSGILPGVALINNFDANGELMRGAQLRLYAAGTSTPVTAFKDSGLTTGQEQPWPIVADSAGRLPMFYLPDGIYRIRLSSDDGGYVAYDVPAIEAVVPSGGGGGGGGGTVSPEITYQTGDIKQRLGSGIHTGFVRLNGRTIGSAGTSATERANNDTQALFEYLWSEFNNTVCPVSGGRGTSATADFNAGKTIQLPDARGRTLYGADGMGTSAAGRLTSATFATPDSVATSGGTEKHVLTQGQLPAVAPTFNGTPMTAHVDLPNVAVGNATFSTQGGSFFFAAVNGLGTEANTDSFTPAGTISNLGSGEAHPTAAPGLIVTIYVKL